MKEGREYFLEAREQRGNTIITEFLGTAECTTSERELRGSDCSDGNPRKVWECDSHTAALFLRSHSDTPVDILWRHRAGTKVRLLPRGESDRMRGMIRGSLTLKEVSERLEGRLKLAREIRSRKGAAI